MTTAELDFIEILELESDERGRVNLTSKYGDKQVKVAVLEVSE
jgi:hypothetical protein